MGKESALAELAASHDDELAVGVDVADAKTARLAGSQAEPVAEAKMA